ncbi:hypothetical protein F5I97DRAFT_1930497 [Phlebopus sp. FC_14]|nr:hypothetical protein F5I97DRAFT_1930497 [Phlebopus sp. FC_14]
MAHDDRDALWRTGQDESVEVNQRALIDKVLARYSGEFTGEELPVFNAMNSDDARSSSVEIRFETAAYLRRKEQKDEGTSPLALPDLKATPVTQWTFRNDGITFRDEDWTRLRKIAEGNPDEEKIGAFGVGFYSLFSVTENPFVSSGGHGMQFYWKDNKDQLHVRRGDLPSKGNVDPWTSFEMTLREPGPIPPAFDFMRFLASSITFMIYLKEVGVFFDDYRIGHLKKSPGPSKSMDLPKGLKRSSNLNIMNIKGIQSHPIRIKAEVMHAVYVVGTERHPVIAGVEPRKPRGGFFSSIVSAFTNHPSQAESPPLPPHPPKDPTELHEMSVTLTIFTAEVEVKVDRKLAAELVRSTKKNPPTQLKYNLIYTGKDEYDQSVSDEKNQPVACGSIFQGLRADLNGAGQARLFIGHATGQTTGIGGHMASRFIPTVERESIDLVDRNVAVWNKELLYVGGFLSRVAYDLELSVINDLWEGAAKSNENCDFRPPSDLEDWLRSRFLHVLKFFTFHFSTPSSEVSRLLEVAFYGCSTLPVKLLCSAGVRDAPDIREPDPTFSRFLKHLPVLPQATIQEGALTVKALQDRGMISPITFLDVLSELRHHPLNEDELVACLQWWTGLSQGNDTVNMPQIRSELLNAAVLVGADGKVVPLASVEYFINARSLGAHIPLDSPLPESLISLSITKHFSTAQLTTFNWREFTIVDWLRHMSKPEVMSRHPGYDFTQSPEWAERVLTVLSRVWSSLSNEAHGAVKAVFSGKKCVPTSCGLQSPDASYFHSIHMNMFNDLPMVKFSSGTPIKGQMDKLLSFIGVRRHVDLQLVFDRMVKTGDWTIPDLVGYLVQVRDTLSDEELSRLASTSAFTKEGDQQSSDKRKPRCRACDLYEPTDILRQLQLPILDWGEKSRWKASSEEAKFLFRLGLRRYPPLETIIELCASQDSTAGTIAFKYLCDNIPFKYTDYKPDRFSTFAFIPAENRDGPHLGNLREVFSNPKWKGLGFSVVQSNCREVAVNKLGIQDHPPTSMLIAMLEKTPPPDEITARQWFEVLSDHISSFSPSQFAILATVPIVPMKGTGPQPVRWLSPAQCYLGGATKGEFHSKLFIFIDFGPVANRFLSACGSKNEPSADEVAGILIAGPKKFYELSGGYENFLVELRNLAVNIRLLSSATLARMKISPILLGVRRQKSTKSTSEKLLEWDEDGWELLHDLRKPRDIVIADDTNAYQLFGDSIFVAPQEDLLENFYHELGSRLLSAVVKDEYQVSNEISTTKMANEVRSLVLERLPIFLHEHTHTRTKVSLSWLSSEQNFRVRAFGKLAIVKTLDTGELKSMRTQDASAAAKRIGFGPIELWLSYGGQVDMVATSLCKLLFETVKVNDALLFMTILSTDLKALKRRGYNVDKILKQQQHDRKMAESRRSLYIGSGFETGLASQPVTPQPAMANRPEVSTARAKSPTRRLGLPGGWEAVPSSPPIVPTEQPRQLADEMGKIAQTNPSPVSAPISSASNAFQNWSRKLVGQARQEVTTLAQSQGTRTVTPQSNIRANVSMAIRACRPEHGKLLRNRRNMEVIKESLDEGYCDVSGHVGDLDHLGTLGEIKVFVTRGVPDTPTFMFRKRDTLARFVHIINPIACVYGLPVTSLHIFYDISGALIAFNRNGSLFLNLRYFEAWHDDNVQKGKISQAQISWFFTLAHEIAHNLVEPHNSEHEFYFSAICEAHITALSQLLALPRQ